MRRLPVPGFDEVLRVPCGSTVAFVAPHAVLAGHAFGGIRYVPDCLANAGAVIVDGSSALGQAAEAMARLARIPEHVRSVVARAQIEDRSPHHVAVEEADAAIAARRHGGPAA